MILVSLTIVTVHALQSSSNGEKHLVWLCWAIVIDAQIKSLWHVKALSIILTQLEKEAMVFSIDWHINIWVCCGVILRVKLFVMRHWTRQEVNEEEEKMEKMKKWAILLLIIIIGERMNLNAKNLCFSSYSLLKIERT